MTLLTSELSAHTHAQIASNQPGEDPTPVGEALGRSTGAALYQNVTNQNIVRLAPGALPPAGGGQPHNNLQPYLTLNFCIALQGIFPPRS